MLLKEEVSLEAEFMKMIGYGDGLVLYVEVMNEMISWPEKQEDDISWAYVALSGEGVSEAVVVSTFNGSVKINDIEWSARNA